MSLTRESNIRHEKWGRRWWRRRRRKNNLGPKLKNKVDGEKVQYRTKEGHHVGKEAQERGRTEENGSSHEGKSRGAKPQPRKGEWHVEHPKDILETWNQAVALEARQGQDTMVLL